MFKNYFKTAIRSLIRNRGYSILNIAGLAAGIAICLVIFIIIGFQTSFDNFHKNKDRIYRVLTEYHHTDSPVFYGQAAPFAMVNTLRANFPQLEKVVPVFTEGNDQILVLDPNGQAIKKFKEEKGVFLTEPSFFDLFDFPWLAGSPATSLKDPNSAVFTKETAERYFGDWKSAIGKSIKWNNSAVLTVTGILENIPKNTDFGLKIIIRYGTSYTKNFAESTDWSGTRWGFGCYVLAPPQFSLSTFNSQLRALSIKMEPADDKDSHILQPLTSVHTDTHSGNFSGKSISPELIRSLWMIAAFILLIACVNFVNLATAQAVNRAREVGVRKVLGSNRAQLKIQFILETLLVVLVSVILAVLITMSALPAISRVLDIPLSFDIVHNPVIVLFLFILIISVTLLAGFYPSLVLSRFNPINALKSRLAGKANKGISLRRGLVVFQFIIAQGLIIGTLIMVKQMNYFTSRPLGFDKDAIVNIPFPPDSIGTSKLDFVRNQLKDIKGIQSVSFNSNTPVEDDNDNWTTLKFDNSVKETDFYSILKWTDDQYLPTYHLPLLAGRNLRASDTAREFVVNEMLIKNLGITDPQKALNKEITLWGGYIHGPIVGVMKDFNARSFRRDLAAVMMTTLKRGYSTAAIKLNTGEITPVMKSIEKIWSTTYPEFVFEYKFMDAKIESFYKHESQLSDLYKIFAIIAIFLSCLGLYGLASFMAVQRIKEVGVRKVLGASVSHIVYLFTREFVILIAIAFLIASPLAWYFMHKWLLDYPFRINISWWIFIAGGATSVLIALATVSFQAIKAAVANPVKSLRTE